MTEITVAFKVEDAKALEYLAKALLLAPQIQDFEMLKEERVKLELEIQDLKSKKRPKTES